MESPYLVSEGSVSGLFRLPPEVRIDIYRRVLSIRRPLQLFQQPGSDKVELFAYRPAQWLALLFTNRQLHAEASAVLYRINHFIASNVPQNPDTLLPSFLRTIGPANAGYVSRLTINFPLSVPMPGETRELMPAEDTLRSLKRFTGLTELNMMLQVQTSEGLTVATYSSDKTQLVRVALSHIDSQIRFITSLRNIVVKVYTRPLAPEVADCMRSLDWVISRGS